MQFSATPSIIQHFHILNLKNRNRRIEKEAKKEKKKFERKKKSINCSMHT